MATAFAKSLTCELCDDSLKVSHMQKPFLPSLTSCQAIIDETVDSGVVENAQHIKRCIGGVWRGGQSIGQKRGEKLRRALGCAIQNTIPKVLLLTASSK